MAEPHLALHDLHKAFSGLRVTDGVELALERGELHALIGPNGAGKTTLIGQITGLLRPDGGRILLDGRDVNDHDVAGRARLGIGRTFQITRIFRSRSAVDNVAFALRAGQGHCFAFLRAARADAALLARAHDLLAEVGLAARAEVRADGLAHGEVRQLELAMALAGDPSLLLLDEPMAGLGPGETQAMIRHLQGLKGRYTILLVEHDMEAVFALADRVSVLVSGRIVATGTAAEIQRDPVVREAYLGSEAEGLEGVAGHA